MLTTRSIPCPSSIPSVLLDPRGEGLGADPELQVGLAADRLDHLHLRAEAAARGGAIGRALEALRADARSTSRLARAPIAVRVASGSAAEKPSRRPRAPLALLERRRESSSAAIR